jgi:hypothetical protein
MLNAALLLTVGSRRARTFGGLILLVRNAGATTVTEALIADVAGRYTPGEGGAGGGSPGDALGLEGQKERPSCCEGGEVACIIAVAMSAPEASVAKTSAWFKSLLRMMA